MISYLDRAFCIHSRGCDNQACYRNYNDEHQRNNTHDLPISIMDFRTDECGFEPRTDFTVEGLES